MDRVPYLDVAGTTSDDGKTSLFILNRDISKQRQVEIVWQGKVPGSVLSSQVLTGNDLKAVNSFESPQRVEPQSLDMPVTRGSSTTFELPPRGYAAIQFSA
jgi:alpha-N-arabinofuranosidase